MTAYWNVAQCCLLEFDRRFSGVYSLHDSVRLNDVSQKHP
jgi:hypothetical protein